VTRTIFELIQRFEVVDGIPRLTSSNINVVEGGEDLMSIAVNLLNKLGFEKQFNLNRASQYIGYRSRTGGKRYQLILCQRKDGVCVSIPKEILAPHILTLNYYRQFEEYATSCGLGTFWVLPSKQSLFLSSLQPEYWNLLQVEDKVHGDFYLNEKIKIYEEDFGVVDEIVERIPIDGFNASNLSAPNTYLVLNEDKLFPYAWQALLTSSESMSETLTCFAHFLMEMDK